MSEITEIVDNLENRLMKLLQHYKNLKENNKNLQDELMKTRNENKILLEEVKISGGKIKTLKAANALLGSNDYKKETKLQINSLIREIDTCIVQLSE